MIRVLTGVARRVDNEGHHTDDGEQGAPPESNVVRLPRDWLGPRDELVPLGDRTENPQASTDPVQTRSAADFGGEGSAAVQDAVEGPTRGASGGEHVRRRRRPRSPRARLARSSSWRRWSERSLAAAGAVRAIGGSRLGRHSRGLIRRWRIPVPRRKLATAAVLAVACVGLIARAMGSGGTGHRLSHAVTAVDLNTSAAGLGVAGFNTGAQPGTGAKHVSAHRPRVKRPPKPSRRVSAPARVAQPAPASSVAATPASYSAPTGSGTSSAGGGSAGSSSGGGSSGSSSGSSGDGGGGGSSAGPTGPGAPFGPGKLG